MFIMYIYTCMSYLYEALIEDWYNQLSYPLKIKKLLTYLLYRCPCVCVYIYIVIYSSKLIPVWIYSGISTQLNLDKARKILNNTRIAHFVQFPLLNGWFNIKSLIQRGISAYYFSRRLLDTLSANIIWASSWDYGTYCTGDQRRLRREPSLFAYMMYGSRRRVRLKIRHLCPLHGCACVFEEWVYGGRKLP